MRGRYSTRSGPWEPHPDSVSLIQPLLLRAPGRMRRYHGLVTDPFPPKRDSDDGKKPSNTRIAIWIGVSAVALYFLGSGIIGIITHGG